ncbi:hypothetical protein Gasu2_03030 [Galdieria sulphuraria]|uniref:Uncharacterized protein n=1 Tax=Galdieria sulphuraria TaxID=130081 RepID=M2Y0H4_GALSU|nr:hypothetical protein Gasu_33340 isoform 2 [Galdieria sulphuraria]XP_005705849.1 hypothetical protein Gasu_33340 isoform 1 [Galdieria sulphuraria]EME29328.1 hypothetical protein isoform 2 [Galdieria sulphuraria]EME29329.1 hypothetical protein isoform 1 [Galdieria sulphuraria]GJD05854.1 hypothetical protein Gasu2_03030 [Galdieria sulphuraria]|eukprot:XP_005705848.1 hypothetical protein isoform 2 [Galdieria sulphuraria]
MKNQTADGNWTPHTKEELDKEMNRQKQLAEREKEAVEELKKIHSNVTSGGLRKQVSADEDSSKTKDFVSKPSLPPHVEKNRSGDEDPNITAERNLAEHASVVKSGLFKEERKKQKSTSSNTSTTYADASTGETQGLEKNLSENLAQDRAATSREAGKYSSRKTLWRFLCCAVVEESK